ncbi:Uncharacterised protein [Legionella wadsworthii]|uniref:Uncharacterized protein n=1 Tax=Legionella wadsworthii TaxID=28088 RepID=A0A378LR65_9GAMM|nr:DUF5630 domain-containing protein [Legionella wadsworthii]STY29283.1 Uncharacterised protein [Legionella wadsworthii]
MKLDKFLELTPHEKMKEIKILNLTKKFDPAFINKIIKNMDLELLLKLAISNPDIDNLCKSSDLESYWMDIWRQCGLNPQEKAEVNHNPIHEYQLICTVPSCFDLIKGLYLYESYRKLFKDKEHTSEYYKDVEEYLAASGLYGCFLALNALCKGGLVLLEQNFDEDICNKIIFYAQVAAKFYWSPGYSLLANIYQELIKYQHEAALEGLNLRLLSFQAMSVANIIEIHSAPMMNNAYQGKKLSEASDGQIQNFSQALMRLQHHLSLSPLEIEAATLNAKIEAHSIKKAYHLDNSLGYHYESTPEMSFGSL